jgi:hypothetical protein
MEEDFALPLPRVLAMNEAEARLGGGSNEEVVTALYEQLRPALLGYVYHLTGSVELEPCGTSADSSKIMHSGRVKCLG